MYLLDEPDKAQAMKKIFKYISGYLFPNLSADFSYLFIRKEGKVLLGKKFSNFFFLLLIFIITFFALGFAKGSLSYLYEKMNDPFIKWVSIDVPYAQADIINSIIKQLSEDKEAQSTYNYENVTGYRLYSLPFFDKKRKGQYFYLGRTIEPDNSLLSVVLKDSNCIFARNFADKRDIGLIVTTKLLRELGYEPKAAFILMGVPDKSNSKEYHQVPIPIIAVVKELPGLTEFFSTPFFYFQRQQPVTLNNPFDPTQTPHVELVSTEKERSANKLKDAIENFMNNNERFKKYNPMVFIMPYKNSFYPGYQLTIAIEPDTSSTLRDEIYTAMMEDRSISSHQFYRYSDYTTKFTNENAEMIRIDRLIVQFSSLDKLREFKQYLSRKHEIRMEMGQVESLENYNFISHLTEIISIILMIFSVITIILFISNLLKNHLERIKMNIGTFKAFGMHHKSLEKIYLSIIFCFIFSTIIISYLLNVAFGEAGGVRLVLILFRSSVESGENYFSLFNYWTVIAVIFILVSSYFALRYTAHKVFKRTPGDLIYDRDVSEKKKVSDK
jgi:hypothetical protein